MAFKSSDLRLRLAVCCLLLLTLKVSLSNANKYKPRNGETGRYTYYSYSQEDVTYCRYCPKIDMLFESEDVNRKYQVESCVEKNSPLLDKLDQEEIEKELYPVCNTGEIPSCALPQNPEGGFWKCEISDNPKKVPVYKTCQLQCETGYKAVGERNIYCNESRKFDPPWTETTCINDHACTLPQNPKGGFWKCEISDKPEKVHVHKTCQLQCDPGYKAVGEGNISCKENHKFDPPWAETTCINDLASVGSPFLALYVSSAVGVLICVLVAIVYCRRKYHQQCENTLSRIERGFKNPKKSTEGLSMILDSIAPKELIDNGQIPSVNEDTNTNTYVDASRKPLLTQEPNKAEDVKNPIENEDQLSYTSERDDNLDCIINEIDNKKARMKAFSDSETSLDTCKYGFYTLYPGIIHSEVTKNIRDVDRHGPEGESFSTTGRNEPPVYPPEGSASDGHQKQKRDSEETLSKEFSRDPMFCHKRVYTDLILELKKHGANKYCEDIVKVVEEMEGHGSCNESSQDDRRHHMYALMREKDVRIGHIVYHISQDQRHDHTDILQQIKKIHPDCNFCKSLYGDMTIH